MKYQKADNGSYVIRIEKEEPVMQTLLGFCKEHGIHGGFFSGLGAVKNAEFGYYDLENRVYEYQTVSSLLELVSMNGNVALVDLPAPRSNATRQAGGEPFLHVHAVFSEEHSALYAGHVKEMVAGVTVEVFLTPAPTMDRAYDDETGLKLLDL